MATYSSRQAACTQPLQYASAAGQWLTDVRQILEPMVSNGYSWLTDWRARVLLWMQMASAIEAMGMSLPYSSSLPAEDPLKRVECRLAGRYGRPKPAWPSA